MIKWNKTEHSWILSIAGGFITASVSYAIMDKRGVRKVVSAWLKETVLEEGEYPIKASFLPNPTPDMPLKCQQCGEDLRTTMILVAVRREA